MARNVRTRFTFDQGNEYEGIWTRDNSRIAFNSSREGSLGIYVKSAGGTGSEELLVLAGLDCRRPVAALEEKRNLLFRSGQQPCDGCADFPFRGR
ncbi:MAG TPA: hypothetical protein VFV95_06950 [Vicinamibacterales bacterium]|nr:hypothetical protein [Vicinamibacterales bacterium]